MNKKVLIVYKSVTGFTKNYAEMIAQEVGCTLLELQKATAEIMSDFDTVVFGGRLHAGTVDGLKMAKELFQQSSASQFLIYATGATPNEMGDIIEEMWRNNLSPAELATIPHFYMQSGLRYENMPFGDKMMIKVFCFIMKRKKEKSEYEKQFVRATACSYDVSSKACCKPLITYLKAGKDGTPDGRNI